MMEASFLSIGGNNGRQYTKISLRNQELFQGRVKGHRLARMHCAITIFVMLKIQWGAKKAELLICCIVNV